MRLSLKIQYETFESVVTDTLFELLEDFGKIPRGAVGFKSVTSIGTFFVVIANYSLGSYHCNGLQDIKIRVLGQGSLPMVIEP